MARTGSDRSLIELLNGLIKLDLDAIEAYRAAVSRVEDLRDRGRIAGFLEEHQGHVTELSTLVRQLGGEPAGAGDLPQMLAKGKAVIRGLFGDRLVLEAMKHNEGEVSAIYERAAARRDLPEHVRAVVARHVAHERRHRDWIVDRLDAAEGLLRL